MRRFSIVVQLCALAMGCTTVEGSLGRAEVELSRKNITKIAFGSCNHQWEPQPLWTHIHAKLPDMFLWLGDAVYADERVLPLVWRPSQLSKMKESYAIQTRHPEYSKFVSTGIPILGIWDDHDYGMNDGGHGYKDAAEVQNIFLDFLNEPQDSIRRQRSGLQTSYLLSSSHGKKIKLILVDTRSQLNRGTGDVLGAEQWQWLQEQLAVGSTEADMMIVTSGMQVISDIPLVDRMERYPKSRNRFLKLLSRYPKLVLLSGDVHYAETNCWEDKDPGHYAVHEMTSSGLTHVCLHWEVEVLDYLCRLTLRLVLQSSYRVTRQTLKKNYGLLEFDWNEKDAKVVFTSQTLDGEDFSYTMGMQQLSTRNASCPPTVSYPLPVQVFFCCATILLTSCLVALFFALKLIKAVVMAPISLFRKIFPRASSKKKAQ